MNAAFINPFIAALLNVLQTMAQIKLVPGKPKKKSDDQAGGDISGLIGMVGEITNMICGGAKNELFLKAPR